MTAFMVRRIVDKENFGVIQSNHVNLFNMVDEHTDPYAFEFTSSRFVHTDNNRPVQWQRFIWPSQMLEHYHG